MNYIGVIHKQAKFYWATWKADRANRNDRDFYWPVGAQLYAGPQGSGKTMSAVHSMLRIKKSWPKCIIVTNLQLTDFRPVKFAEYTRRYEESVRDIPLGSAQTEFSTYRKILAEDEYVFFDDFEDLKHCLTKVNNGKFGVHILIDEIHTYWNAKDSKNIPMYVFTEISQQRKQRKTIVGTSQRFHRIAIAIREQAQWIIVCRTILGIFTMQYCFTGNQVKDDTREEQLPSPKRLGFFFHSPEDRRAYDTFQKVVSGADFLDNTSINVLLDKPKSFRKR